MRSSSTEPAAGRRRPFLPAGAGAWARLAVVALLGAGALAGPVAPQVGRTGALYTDAETVGFDVGVPPAPPDEAGAEAQPDGVAVPEEPAPDETAPPDETASFSPAEPRPTPSLGSPSGGVGDGHGRWRDRPLPGGPRHDRP